MQRLSVKTRLAQTEALYGLFNSIPDPLMIEIMAASGFDFVIIDTEHVEINDETLAHLIRTAEAAHIIPIVRVTQAIERDIIKVLDMGARGIIVPHVKDKQTAEQVVKLSRYYPQGMRSLNGGRMAQFGEIPLDEAMKQANAHIMVIVMIEDIEGVEAIEEIVQVDGIDMIIEGAADLSQSLGLPWQTTHPTVRDYITRVFEATQAHDKLFCALPRTQAHIKEWQQKGVKMFVLGDDRGKIYRHFKQTVGEIKEVNIDGEN
ncbi:HpcH/HpaI aldolase/citrate lyase family protein [Staphylococcus schleiferi]|uniref:HpcH/HpaI aldolase family protein n=1 Tax=Staphylococcus schleiferi TaxID=1295 RepID=UPI0021D0826B|nr:HpcH/HpaI aldolase/citrate lyase family protein [Staphylococcus schleiferi]UXR55045.1 HpcH/HpaI aldolase/citrate lyase family protein [Staphylococcus schleiferi]